MAAQVEFNDIDEVVLPDPVTPPPTPPTPPEVIADSDDEEWNDIMADVDRIFEPPAPPVLNKNLVGFERWHQAAARASMWEEDSRGKEIAIEDANNLRETKGMEKEDTMARRMRRIERMEALKQRVAARELVKERKRQREQDKVQAAIIAETTEYNRWQRRKMARHGMLDGPWGDCGWTRELWQAERKKELVDTRDWWQKRADEKAERAECRRMNDQDWWSWRSTINTRSA